ncbi:MAG: dienelactone hydrolase family protein, partial [Bdellovibrionales bacterium]|nr:dienelactone hydrolase family protein [Bdellovibrionales bacterium]
MKFIIFFTCILAALSVHAKDYTYNVDGKPYEGFYIDKGKSSGLIFIVHDWDGLTDYEKKRSQMLADLGYSVFAMDLYGKGIRPEELKDKKALTSGLYGNRKKMKMLMNAAYQQAKKLGLNVNKAVALGYCFGGTSILEWAKTGIHLKGFASFHGGLGLQKEDNYKSTKSKIIVFHGSADESVSMTDFAQLTEHLESHKIPHEMITYSGAP